LLSPLCRLFTIIYLKRTMFLGYIVLQLFCIYNLCFLYCYFAREICSVFYITFYYYNYYYYYLRLLQAMLSVVELLTRYLLGGCLHHGILKWVYKARNMVKWHDHRLSVSLSAKWTSFLKTFLTVEQVFSYTTFWTWDSRPSCKWRVVRLWLSMLGMSP
jgi:hypothetical protein